MRTEDVQAQSDRLLAARLELAGALDHLAGTAKAAARRRTDLEDVYGAAAKVRRAEEAVDIATLDLAAARGEDV